MVLGCCSTQLLLKHTCQKIKAQPGNPRETLQHFFPLKPFLPSFLKGQICLLFHYLQSVLSQEGGYNFFLSTVSIRAEEEAVCCWRRPGAYLIQHPLLAVAHQVLLGHHHTAGGKVNNPPPTLVEIAGFINAFFCLF